MQDLEIRLRNDLSKIGLNAEFTLSIRPYSKSYYGRYDIRTNTIILYVQKTPKGEMYSYEELLLTTIHEAIHCLQWNDPLFKRVKGVMHDVEFKRLYSVFENRAKARILFKEVLRYDNAYKKSTRDGYDRLSACC